MILRKFQDNFETKNFNYAQEFLENKKQISQNWKKKLREAFEETF